MTTYSVAEAKNALSDLIDRALRGEGVVVTRHGTPVVELRAIRPVPEPLTEADIAWLEARRVKPEVGHESPSASLQAIRDAGP